MGESPSTPERYAMRLRSVCRQYGCNLEQFTEGGSPRSSPSQQLRQAISPSFLPHHLHHHHTQTGLIHEKVQTSHSLVKSISSSVETSSKVQSLNTNQVTPSKKGITTTGHLHSALGGTTKRSAASRSRRSYSDYSSGNDDSDSEIKEKTDYTYAKSSSYNSRVTPSRSWENPNMSRTRLSRSLHSSNQSSSSEDDFMLFGKGLLSSHSKTNGTPAEYSNSGSFVKSSKSLLKKAGYSTMIKHSYGLDSEYSESEDENSRTRAQSHRHTETSEFNPSPSSYLQRISFIRWLSELNCWMWYSCWSSLYKLVCHILLFDTWLLSRSFILSKKKLFCFILLPLFLPLLFLLGQNEVDSGSLSSATSLSNATLSVMTNLLLFTSWRHTDVSVRKTSSESTSGWSLWSYIFGHDDNSKVHHHLDASSIGNFPRLGSRDEIQNIVRNIFKEELSGWMAQVTKEHEAAVQRQIDEFSQQTIDLKTLQQNHLQHLTMELSDLKLSIQSNSRETTDEGKKLDQEFLQLKLEHLEAQLHGMQEILLSLRNCCRNQTDYISAAERHLATLLIQIMNGSGTSTGPFAAFGDWMRTRFVNYDELKVHITSMADHISSDVSEQAENVARQTATALILKSLNEIKSNMSMIPRMVDHHHHMTQVCASEEEIKTIVREAIYLYDADKTGLVDYALESSGGSVISTRCAETYHTGTAQFRLFGIPFWYTSNSPRTVIQPEVHPGQCWAFKGTHGYLVIELSATIKPTAFSLEHIPKSLSPTGSIDSAPKEFSVIGLKKETDLEGVLLGKYTYNADGEPLQYFAVADPDVDSYPIMELRIHSNYGNLDYTCLYRFRVHGTRQ